jgi:3-dehydroquinate dehydratase / shikimate dehydrogenase
LKAKLCATVTAATTAELRRRRDDAADADLVELRLDTVNDPDVAGALAGRRTPVIVTCRARWEGGSFAGSEEERKRILADAIAGGAEYVDIEWRAGFDDLIAASRGRGIVVSMHEHDGVPPDLMARVEAMKASGAEVVKAAVVPRRLADCVPLLHLGSRADLRGTVALIAMGEYGIATRVLAARFGSPWAYAGALRDIGQISLDAMLKEFHFRTLSDQSDVYGIVGASVQHSVSPAMHNAAFRARGLDAVYVPLPATSADDFMTFARALGLRGASVTIPYKIALFDRVDEVYSSARRIGAVNTIRFENGRCVGDNTDAAGFLHPLQERIAVAGLRASVVGAGGAARAVADALAASNCSVTIHARRRSEAERVASQTSANAGPFPPQPDTWDLLINCTPVGQTPNTDATPVPKAQLTGRCVYDLVYNPTSTRLLREAAEMGCQTIGGLEMLVAQAHDQFRWWTGARPPTGIMREAALKRLAEFARDENHVV